jgi:hypothetical protein
MFLKVFIETWKLKFFCEIVLNHLESYKSMTSVFQTVPVGYGTYSLKTVPWVVTIWPLQEAIDKLARQRTSLIIAHRLSTIVR